MQSDSKVGSKEKDGGFEQSHSLHDLERRTVSSGIVRAIAQAAQFVVTMAYNVIMARLLTPHQYGLVAMVMTIVGMLQIFRDLGLSTATIQRADITHAQVSNLFWLNVVSSGVISLLMAIGAPVIAWYYKEASLVSIALALSSSFLLSGLAAQHVALLQRDMRFNVISAMEVSALTLGCIVGVCLAFAGFGYWSLVASTLTQAVARIAIVWFASGWRPQRPVRGVGTRPLIMFGANLTAGGLFYSFSRSCEGLLIGRTYGAFEVGLYTRAAAILLRPLDQLTYPIFSVTIPALSRLLNQGDRYKSFFLQLFESLAIGGFILTAVVLPLARPLTDTLLGNGWHDAASIFAGLSFAGIYVPLSAAAGLLYTTQSRGRELAILSMIEASVAIAAIFVGLPFGPTGVAIAMSFSGMVVNLPLTFYMSGRKGSVRTIHLWTSCLRHLPVFVATFGVTYAMQDLTSKMSPITQLFAGAAVGLATATATIFLSPPSRETVTRMISALRMRRSGKSE